jgi:hypothetical protein
MTKCQWAKLRQWLSQFGDKQRDHYSKGNIQKLTKPTVTLKANPASRNAICTTSNDATTGSTALPLPTATESKVPYIDSTSVALTQESWPT